MSKYAPHRHSNNRPTANSSSVCQKCLGTGHFIFDCKNSRPYVSRPSRTDMLKKPHMLEKLKAEGKPSVEVPEEFKKKSGTANKILEAKEKEREEAAKLDKGKGKEIKSRKRSQSPSSGSSSSDSDSDSSSDSGSERSRTRSPSRKRVRRSEERSPRRENR